MKIIVDTCVWSQALRKKSNRDRTIVNELTRLIQAVRIQLIGPIRQEILSGIRNEKQFEELKHFLSAFPDQAIETQDYEKAAQFFNICRAKGVQGSNTDFLICAVSSRKGYDIFTVDKDFENYQKYLPINLHQLRKSV